MDRECDQSGHLATVRFVPVGWRGRLRRIAAGVVLAVVLVLAAACTGDSDPSPTIPSSTASSTGAPESTGPSTTTPTTATTATFVPVAPVEPPAKPTPEQTPESAVAFLEWWIAVLNYAELTGDTAELQLYSLPECVFCGGQIDRIESVYSAGSRIERSGETTLVDLAPSPLDLDASVLIQATGQSPPTRFIDATGQVTEESVGVEPAPYLVGLAWDDSGWKVRGVSNV